MSNAGLSGPEVDFYPLLSPHPAHRFLGKSYEFNLFEFEKIIPNEMKFIGRISSIGIGEDGVELYVSNPSMCGMLLISLVNFNDKWWAILETEEKGLRLFEGKLFVALD